MNKNIRVCFDLDGTLIYESGLKENMPRYDVIQLFKLLESFGFDLYVWSGGGENYCMDWVKKLGLDVKVIEKGSIIPDIAIDNERVNLSKLNVKV